MSDVYSPEERAALDSVATRNERELHAAVEGLVRQSVERSEAARRNIPAGPRKSIGEDGVERFDKDDDRATDPLVRFNLPRADSDAGYRNAIGEERYRELWRIRLEREAELEAAEIAERGNRVRLAELRAKLEQRVLDQEDVVLSERAGRAKVKWRNPIAARFRARRLEAPEK